MGLKDRMMESMIANMTSEEKSALMGTMMDRFLGSMTAEEKQGMWQAMMPKMMGEMMGGGSMMGAMMKTMMQDRGEGGESPMSMCRRMMSTISQSSDLATFATPEIRGLFEDWVRQIEEEIVRFVEETKTTDEKQIASHFKISEPSAAYLLSRLAQKGVVSVKAEKKV